MTSCSNVILGRSAEREDPRTQQAQPSYFAREMSRTAPRAALVVKAA